MLGMTITAMVRGMRPLDFCYGVDRYLEETFKTSDADSLRDVKTFHLCYCRIYTPVLQQVDNLLHFEW